MSSSHVGIGFTVLNLSDRYIRGNFGPMSPRALVTERSFGDDALAE
jgi:hypothetical protein